MLPVETRRTNHNFGPPPGMEGRIGDLPCQIVEVDEAFGGRAIYSVWALTSEERTAIANGMNVRLGVGWIGGFPPVSLGVTHEGTEHQPETVAEAQPFA
jgi:hypothetical protein